ncbi:MAG: cupin domain-containing protein, partial [Gammaproteobacteria bacterium]|nr:cupin domain-containing protein [Gammaproteobacteria bacterium]
DVSFHPKLDPQGEEVYVLSGELRDVDGTYHAGSWIRNPVPFWQAWSGQPGTMIFYKSGHFIDCL